jgi:biotin carboxylase
MKTKKQPKNIIVFVHKIPEGTIEIIRKYQKKNKVPYRIALLTDIKKNTQQKKDIDLHLSCDTSSKTEIQKMLLPIQDQILAITARGDAPIPLFSKIIPHVPYLRTPSPSSLKWATEKILMRRRFSVYDKKISPQYILVKNLDKNTFQKIEKRVGYPAIIKPTGLTESKLVTIVYHRDELEKALHRIFRSIKSIYKKFDGRWEPNILVEQFMEGEMYSLDGHVTSRGKIYFCPLVHIKTGRSIGFDDFFGYAQITPTLLKKNSIQAAEKVATKAVHALGLRSTSVHIELMKMENGWKVIELGPRVGGFRHNLYELSYGINLTINDIKIRIPEKISIPKKTLGYSIAMKFFAKKQGILTNLIGTKKAESLDSFQKIIINKKIGDKCTYAKNGGSSVFNIILFNKNRSKLLADVRRLEQTIKIETK